MRNIEAFISDKEKKNSGSTAALVLAMTLCAPLLFLAACGDTGLRENVDQNYKAVLLNDGRVLFGTIAETDSTHVTLRDVIYVETASDKKNGVQGRNDAAAERSTGQRRSEPVRIPGSRIVMMLDTDYRAVYLDDGRAFLGRLEETGPTHVLLKDAHDIYSRTDEGDVKRTFIERPDKWRASDLMYLSALHIAAMELSLRKADGIGSTVMEGEQKVATTAAGLR